MVLGADPAADRLYWEADLSLPLVLVVSCLKCIASGAAPLDPPCP